MFRSWNVQLARRFSSASSFCWLSLSLIIAGLVLQTTFLQAADDPVELSLSVPAEDFQKQFDERLKQKYAPDDLILYYVSPGKARFSAIWRKQPDAQIQVKAGITRDALKQAIEELGKKGYRLHRLTGSGSGGPERYTAIWRKGAGQKLEVKYDIDRKRLEYRSIPGTQLAGYKGTILNVAQIEIGNEDRFTAVLEQNETAHREIERGLSLVSIKREQKIREKNGFRVRQLMAYKDGRSMKYAGIWEKSPGVDQQIGWNLSARRVTSKNKQLQKSGYQPVHIHAYAINGRERFIVVWEKKTEPSK